MTDQGNFDPAKAIDFDQDKARQRVREQRAAEEAEKEAEKQRAQAQQDLHRANLLKLFRYADEQLGEIRNPVVSEFVVVERREYEVGFFRKRTGYHQRETRYYGSWLSLYTTQKRVDQRFSYYDVATEGRGLVKLLRPHAGYAWVEIRREDYDGIRRDWDLRNEVSIIRRFNTSGYDVHNLNDNEFRIFKSLEEVTEAPGTGAPLGSVETLTKEVTQALDFVATGQPPEPK